MYIHFEDWTSPINLLALRNKGLPCERIIKVFASQKHPEGVYNKTNLTIVEDITGEPFQEDEIFKYENRETYTGPKLEQDLKELGLSESENKIVRTLFRLANLHEFCQTAMAANKEDGSWAFNHPFRDIHIKEGGKLLPNQESNIHLDIFYPPSLEKLKSIVDYEDPKNVITLEELRELKRKQIRLEKENVGKHPERL